MKYSTGDKVIGFNSEWVASKTIEQFMKHEARHGLSEKQMIEIHSLCQSKHGVKVEVKAKKSRKAKNDSSLSASEKTSP